MYKVQGLNIWTVHLILEQGCEPIKMASWEYARCSNFMTDHTKQNISIETLKTIVKQKKILKVRNPQEQIYA